MSMTEILDELSRLSDGERQAILRRLVQLDAGLEIDETPEMLAAIDAGVRSLETTPGVPLEEARQRLAGWDYKVILSPLALDDLEQIVRYVAADDPATA